MQCPKTVSFLSCLTTALPIATSDTSIATVIAYHTTTNTTVVSIIDRHSIQSAAVGADLPPVVSYTALLTSLTSLHYTGTLNITALDTVLSQPPLCLPCTTSAALKANILFYALASSQYLCCLESPKEDVFYTLLKSPYSIICPQVKSVGVRETCVGLFNTPPSTSADLTTRLVCFFLLSASHLIFESPTTPRFWLLETYTIGGGDTKDKNMMPGTTFCRVRPKAWKVLLAVVAVLMTAQFSFNLLFYRNYDSLFNVNVTSSSGDGASADLNMLSPLQSKLKWISWLQPIPVPQPSPVSSKGNLSASGQIPGTKSHNKSSTVGSVQVSLTQASKHKNDSAITDSEVKEKNVSKKIDIQTPPLKGNNDATENKPGKEAANNVKTTKPLHEVSRSVDQNITSGSVPELSPGGSQSIERPICPPVPPNLVGRVKVERTAPSLEEQERTHTELEPGGHYRPPECQARHKVAIIIPYRDRVHHLTIFLHHLHSMLQRQQIDYAIFVVEQAGNGKFNRAMLMNVGALEALRQYRFSCFIFHDVDLLPEDDRNLYTCPDQPRHMSIAINIMKYKLPYTDIFGGVSAMTVDQFRVVNGFSNKFWGWGGEDDDMSNRIKYHGFFISRYPANIGRYTMLSHKKDEPNPRRYQYLHDGKKRYKSDGLNSVKYRTLDIQLRRLYTWVYVDLLPS
ncbi:hypothetical protein Pmani_038622 [Petrolisthes manimaculis]|uniref:Beta-1,4-N-acetylgalactosaminyltransferase bre-4 n=1 Tax=Petrolisthes manimaculis TaxID=1843537 RepID=A0AAE1NEB3_9EUCA|nr:hypothetical protein Pmani_038622 [Petrolisthes manimaculis]